MKCFLRLGTDYLVDASEHSSITAAKGEFLRIASSLARFGQAIDASIHIAESREEVQEYPDYVLSLGPRGGLKMERV